MTVSSRLRAFITPFAAVVLGGAGLAIATAVPAAAPAGAVTCDLAWTFGSGNDVINVNVNGVTVCAGGGNDTVTVSGNAVTVYGEAGDDTVTLSGLIDTAYGGDGNDHLNAKSNLDTMWGDAGTDTLDASTAPAAATLIGGDGVDTLTGSKACDNLSGGADADTINSGSNTSCPAGDGLDYSDHTSGVSVNVVTGANSDGDTLTGTFASINGTSFNDTLTGAIVLTGGLGNDTLDASAAPAAATLKGGDGLDTLIGSSYCDTLVGGNDQDSINAGSTTHCSGGDTLDYSDHTSGVNADVVSSDPLHPNEDSPLTGYFGTLIGTSGADVLKGDDANTLIDGGLGNDTIDGRGGTDTVTYASRTGKVTADLSAHVGGEGTEQDGYTSIENIIGGAGNDVLTGDANNNVLTGGSGNDTLQGGLGTDTLDGGAGTDDTVVYADAGRTLPVTATIAAGTTLGNGQSGENDTLTAIENLTGGGEDDTFNGSSTANEFDPGFGADTVVGNGGNDSITYADAGRTLPVKVVLSAGQTTGNGTVDANHNPVENDTLTGIRNITGGAEDDDFTANDAGSQMDGGDGTNYLHGGAGNDILSAGTGGDHFFGGGGEDDVDYTGRQVAIKATIDLSSVSPANPTCDDGQNNGAEGDCIASDIEDLDGGTQGDNLTGNDKANVIAGNGGTNQVFGGDGDDTLSGRGTLSGQNGNDTLISAGNNADVLYGGDALSDTGTSDTASYAGRTAGVTVNLATGANTDNDSFFGIENVTGGSGDDNLTGDNHRNTLKGLGGNDTLAGNEDDDTLDGGPGTDIGWGDFLNGANIPGTNDTCTNIESSHACEA